MPTILFNSIIFGPIQSRRLGISLGINLLPSDGKLCNFNCVYCECGLNSVGKGSTGFPPVANIKEALEERLSAMASAKEPLDAITFAGNGEPTLHPDFHKVIEATLLLRDQYYPCAKVSVLSNATQLKYRRVFSSLKKVDYNILKLDSVIPETVALLNGIPSSEEAVAQRVDLLKSFRGNLIIQIMFLRGKGIDNTSDKELIPLIEATQYISPLQVMIYSLDRETPIQGLEKINKEELEKIAAQFEKAGLKVSISA